MLRGEFAGDTGIPRVECAIWIPRFNLRHIVRFCLDTGATYSMLTAGDAGPMGVDYRLLSDELDLATAGGSTSAFVEPAELTFQDRDANTAYSYLIMMAIAAPSVGSMRIPSLLGRDIINRWRIDYHPTAGALTCEVITADETIDLGAT